MASITDLIRYIAAPLGLGVGTSNLAYNPKFTIPQQSPYNRKYNVQAQLNPTAPAFFKAAQDIPTVPIEGNGLAIQGQMALQMLQEATRESEAQKGK